jgi:hypothetical protein
MSLLSYVPISGVTDSTGAVLALSGLVSNSSLLVAPSITGSNFQSDTTTFGGVAVSAEMLASVDFRGFSMTAQGNAVYFIFDVTATQTVAENNASSPVAAWAIGVGIRLAVRGLGIKSSASLNVGSLAASATLNGTATSFEFQTIGLGLPVLPMLKGLVNQSTRGFDVSTLVEVGNVYNDILAFVANAANAGQLQPQVVGVYFSTGAQVQSAAATYGFALRGVQKGLSLQQLQAKTASLPNGISLDANIQSTVYQQLVGGSATTTPTNSQRDVANQLANSGG